MINDLLALINSETIYLVANWGVIPFWLLLIIFPSNGLTNFFVQSVIPITSSRRLYLLVL